MYIFYCAARAPRCYSAAQCYIHVHTYIHTYIHNRCFKKKIHAHLFIHAYSYNNTINQFTNLQTYIVVYKTKGTIVPLTLCSPSSTFGTSVCLPDLTFGTNTVAMHTELNPIVLHLWTQWHCLELSQY